MKNIEKIKNAAFAAASNGLLTPDARREVVEDICKLEAEHAALVAVAKAAEEVNTRTYGDWCQLANALCKLSAARAGSEVAK